MRRRPIGTGPFKLASFDANKSICKSDRNYTKYCNPQVETLLEEQSRGADAVRRRQIVWQIEKILAQDVARPIIFHNRAATCWQAHLKGHVQHENSPHNNWRFESVWLDK
jgi:peptide/nickel transport system substrate-binding protein